MQCLYRRHLQNLSNASEPFFLADQLTRYEIPHNPRKAFINLSSFHYYLGDWIFFTYFKSK